jgi:hypothetical protein
MRVNPLQAIRIGVVNLAAARHFWESAFGFQFAGETEVHDPVLRRLWDTDGGTMQVARLDLQGHVFPRLELFQWEGCEGKPIRDPLRPWDFGVREMNIPVWPNFDRSRLERLKCRFVDESVFINPFGERCRLAAPPYVALTVPAIEPARSFFGDLASGQVEVTSYKRIADPREAMDTAPRMSPRYTGVWMLTTAVDRLPEGDPRIVDCDVPFVGRTRAIVSRAPGGVRFGMFEALP